MDPQFNAPFDLEMQRDERRHTIVLRGELDMASRGRLEAAIRQACDEGARELVLDMRELGFIDSTGLREVLLARQQCGRRGAELYVVPSAEGVVPRVLELSGFADELQLIEGPEERLADVTAQRKGPGTAS
jgi:anti-anti-sigma factor